MQHELPRAHGLYDPRFEQDACGIGFVADVEGRRTHQVLRQALGALRNLAHRGAVSADGLSGDGAGVTTQIPYKLLTKYLAKGATLDRPEDLAVGMLFLPREEEERCTQIIEAAIAQSGLRLLGWRDVPVGVEALGARARAAMPMIRQVLVGRTHGLEELAFEQRLYLTRRRIERRVDEAGISPFYVPSFSHRTVVYKGLMVAHQLDRFYPDLADPDYRTAIALFHQRYSTNTFPTWSLAQPFRLLGHNGEINTLLGNLNWMKARERELRSSMWGAEIEELLPVVQEGGSDSAALDNVFELLTVSGRDALHAMMMLIPEAYEGRPDLEPEVRGFYEYHQCLMEPWDGPAAIVFTDGRYAAAGLDRNGLRPQRYWITSNGIVIVGSEAGVVPKPSDVIVEKGRLGPGQMFAVDVAEHRILDDRTIKRQVARQRPYREWVERHLVRAPRQEVRALEGNSGPDPTQLRRAQLLFGYGTEDLERILEPMLYEGKEPLGSMGDDTPLAALSAQPQLLYRYFKQRFAQVTNPPIDPLRERTAMSLTTATGPWGLLLDEREEFAKLVEFPSPILAPSELAWVEQLGERDGSFRCKRLDTRFRAELGAGGLEVALADLCRRAESAVDEGHSLLVLSDRACDEDWAPIPMLLATSAVHHHLIEVRKRMQVSLICDSGEAREDHHYACLIGYGATLVHPWLAYRSVEALALAHPPEDGLSVEEALARYRGAVEKGLLKIMSKMGICPASSYQGAQIFETIGLDKDLVDRHFVGTASRINGVNLFHIATDALAFHDRAYGGDKASDLKRPGPAPAVAARSAASQIRPGNGNGSDADHTGNGSTGTSPSSRTQDDDAPAPASDSAADIDADTSLPIPDLPDLGIYRFRKDGEYHALGPNVFKALHKAVRTQSQPAYDSYARLVDERPPMTLRDLLDWVPSAPPIPLSEVEPATEIAKRFCTQAMSHGAISSEAHEALAVAMNRIGGKSNSGEGGEARDRFYRFDHDQDERGHSPWKPRAGDWANSAIKQVASGRFGVTPEYLVAAKELEIKMAQGSKPGEGGQIPGHKVSEEIAAIRRSVPGVTLISPPPHHDIYSIEDLAQLIYDLKRVNGEARIGVKLVSGAGVGTIAAGVAKGYADSIQLSGHDGGTGASPLGSIRNAGLPWELGLAEAQQVLVRNSLRERVNLRVDGGLKTGRDVVIAALLGAEEFGFGTTSLVALGCIMARQCHLNTCPVGVATQNPALRAKFPGEPDNVVSFLMFIAEHVRHVLASMGVAKLDEIVGRTELLKQRDVVSPKGVRLDLSALLVDPDPDDVFSRRRTWARNDRPPEDPLDQRVFQDCKKAVALAEPLQRHYEISNRDRTVGARLSGEIARTWRDRGLPEGTIDLTFHGIAGQSFGAFASNGMRMTLVGEAQDYVGKGMGGGEIAIKPPVGARFESWKNVVLGNTVLYGATGGALYAAGRAGERLAVRNSGARCVVEGCGDHGCEYMTGGVVVVLGATGKNFAAGMSGGVAYVLDLEDRFPERLNAGMVREERLGILAGGDVAAGPPAAGTNASVASGDGDGLLLELIARHRDLTGSARAAWVLASWESLRGRFWKIVPQAAAEAVVAAPREMKTDQVGVSPPA